MSIASPSVRSATPADADAIRGLVNAARLNPRDLDWRRFLVAEDRGVVVACAQVRVHGRGSRELASVAVAPGRRGQGIGRLVSEAAIAREPVRPLYLYTESGTESYWARFAFAIIDGDAIPADMRGALRIGRAATRLYGLVTRRRMWLVVMRRDDP